MMFATKESSVLETVRELGFEPMEGKCIIVKPTGKSSDWQGKLAEFISAEYFALQLCENELVFVPFNPSSLKLEALAGLIILKSAIRAVHIREDGLNNILVISTETEQYTFSIQKKTLSSFRSSGLLSSEYNNWGSIDKYWHVENLDRTLADLQRLPA